MAYLSPNSYQKGGWVLHMLRYRIGTEAFWDGIEAYYKTYRDANATSEDLRDVMEAASGQDLDAFFEQWLYRAGHPIFEGTWTYDADTRQLRIDLAQTQDGPAFDDLGRRHSVVNADVLDAWFPPAPVLASMVTNRGAVAVVPVIPAAPVVPGAPVAPASRSRRRRPWASARPAG